MKYLVVQHEIAYITKYDGEAIEDSWDAPEGKRRFARKRALHQDAFARKEPAEQPVLPRVRSEHLLIRPCLAYRSRQAFRYLDLVHKITQRGLTPELSGVP